MLYYSYFIMLGLYRSYRHPFRQNYLLFPDFTTPLFLLILSVKSKLNWKKNNTDYWSGPRGISEYLLPVLMQL